MFPDTNHWFVGLSTGTLPWQQGSGELSLTVDGSYKLLVTSQIWIYSLAVTVASIERDGVGLLLSSTLFLIAKIE